MDRRKADDNRLNGAQRQPGTNFVPGAEGAQETTRDETTSDETTSDKVERVRSARRRRERGEGPTARLRRDSRLDYRIAPPRKISQNGDHRPHRAGGGGRPHDARQPACAMLAPLLERELGA